jgi:hypothetical protein
MYTHSSFWASVGGGAGVEATGTAGPDMTGGVVMTTGCITGGVGGFIDVVGAARYNVFNACAVVIIFGGRGCNCVLLNSLCTFAWELF